MSNSLQPMDTRLPCPSPTPRACSNSCPSSWWCHPTMPSVVPFSCLQSFPDSGSFPRSPFFRIRWPKYWSFSFSITRSNEYSGLISCRIDWLELLAVQGTLKSLLQHHSSKASILQHSAFFIVQLSHPYMTTGKTIALTEVKWSEVAQSCPTLYDPMDCTLLCSSVQGIFQARVLEWVAISSSRGSSWPRDWTQVSHTAGRRFTIWATREVQLWLDGPLLAK